MKRKLLLAALFVVSAFGFNAKAQTDVTDTYLTNADFSSGTVASTDIYGYGKDGNPYGLQPVEGWSTLVLSGDNSNATYPNSGMGGAIFQYGSSQMLRGNQKTAPATNPNGDASGNCLGFFAVWGCGGYYYQDVTLQAGSYTITIPVYNASGTQSNTSYIGFIPETGSSYTVATNPTVGEWTTQTINFELAKETKGKIALGYKSAGNGSGPNSHLFFDCVKIEYEEANLSAFWAECKTAASTALANPEYANVSGSEKTALESEVAKAEPTNNAGYSDAITALQNATNAFTAAKASYDAYVSAREEGANYTSTEWPYTSEAKQTALTSALKAEPTTADDASAKANAIVTAYRQFVESNGKAEGVSEAVDYTLSMKGTDASVSASGWTGFSGTNQGQSYTDGNGNTTNKYFDGGWNSNAGVNITATQNITLPSGKYLMQITARGATDMDTYTLGVGEESVDLPKDGNVGGTFGNGWSDRYLVFESDGTELTVKITAKSTATKQWISFNRIRLVQLEMYAEKATADDYEALNNAIAVAEGKTLGFDEGEYAPYNNIEAIKVLAAAKAINQSADNAKEDVNAAKDALENATWTVNETEVNAVYDGSFNLTTLTSGSYIIPTGWTNVGYNTRVYNSSNMGDNTGVNATSQTACMFAKFTTEYGTEEGYTMPLKAGVYTLDFIYGGWNEKGTRVIKIYNADNNAEITPNSVTAKDNQAHKKTESWAQYSGIFEIPADGNYILSFYRENTSSQNQICISDIEIFRAPEVSVTMNISDAKYSTFIAPFEVTIPGGVTASKVTGATDGVLTLEDLEGTIPANTPVVLYSENGCEETFIGTDLSTDVTYTVGLLTGTYEESTTVPAGSYVLQTQDNGQKFYLVGANTTFKMPNRAYLTVPAESAGVKAFSFGGETTGINGVETLTDGAVESIYTINGTRVNSLQKGLNIVKMSNGKTQKVLVK